MDVLVRHGIWVFGRETSYAEFFGQLCALAVVFLAQRRTLGTWPVQLGATVLLFATYTSAHLGGLAARQVAIFAISLYGWWAWTRHRGPVYGVVVRRASTRERIGLLAAYGVGTAGMAWLLAVLHASWSPVPDAWIFVGTLIAFAAQGMGLVEFWLVWLLVDAVGVPLQVMSGLWFSALVYVVFAVLVVRGWVSWARSARGTAAARQDALAAGPGAGRP